MNSRNRKKPGRKSRFELVGAKTYVNNQSAGISNKIYLEKEKKIKELNERTLRFIEELTEVIRGDIEPYFQSEKDSFVNAASEGSLDVVESLYTDFNEVLDNSVINNALLQAIKNEQVDIVNYLPIPDSLSVNEVIESMEIGNENNINISVTNKINILAAIKQKNPDLFNRIYIDLIIHLLDFHDAYATKGKKIFLTSLIEKLLKNPDFNPEFHHLDMPHLGLELAMKKNRPDLYKWMVKDYELFNPTLAKKYNDLSQNEGSQKMQFMTSTHFLLSNNPDQYCKKNNPDKLGRKFLILSGEECQKEKNDVVDSDNKPEMDVVSEVNVTMNQYGLFYHVDVEHDLIANKEKLYEDGNNWIMNI